MGSKKRRLGSKVFHLDDDIYFQCRSNGIDDKDILRMKMELSAFGIKSTSSIAAAIALREMKKRNNRIL